MTREVSHETEMALDGAGWLLMPLTMLWRAYVVMHAWNWLLVPASAGASWAVPESTLTISLAICAFIAASNSRYEKAERNPWQLYWHWFVVPAVSLGMAYFWSEVLF